MFVKLFLQKLTFILLPFIIISFAGSVVYGATKHIYGSQRTGQPSKKDTDAQKKSTALMSEATLQSHVMSFADRFTSIMVTALDEFEDLKPGKETHYDVSVIVTYSMSNAYIIAGESDPDVALLDLLSMVTIGRIVFEEEGPEAFGSVVEPVIKGFQKAEKDIRQIAAGILSADQLNNLMTIIMRWRKQNPEMTFFPLVRFSNFAADRRESTLTRAEEPQGLFDSVEAATEQAEEMRLLAERGMYLATRMPQLWGLFGELWLSRLFKNPDLARVLADVSQLSQVSERMATAAENLPGQLGEERRAAITQFMDAVTVERKAAMDDFLAEEKRIKGLLTDLNQTLETGNELVVSANEFMAYQAKPFDIEDYRKALVELSNSTQELAKLAASVERISTNVGADQLVPQLLKAIDKAEKESEELASHTMRLIIMIIGFWFLAYVIARLLILYVGNKMKAPGK